MVNVSLIAFFFYLNFYLTISTLQPTYNTKYTNVPLDHFTFVSNDTFKLRYLVNDTFWESDGPIFFYTGNEGEITLFAENTGFMWDIASDFHALLVFAEHRYYGESLPFGNKSFSDPKYSGFLSSSQALEDFVHVINIIKRDYNISDCRSKIIAFGGSYGGMLASWFRMKYPSLINGAIASSAPIWQFTGLTPCNIFNRITSSVFAQAKPGCDRFIKKSWSVFNSVGNSDGGRMWLSSAFKTCKPIKTIKDLNVLKDWIVDTYGNLAMINYPYPADFLNPLPAHPVKAVCDTFPTKELSDKDILRSIFNGISVYFNTTGNKKCLDVQDAGRLGIDGWDYQSCTEMVMPMCDDGVSDMFEKKEWNIKQVSEDCFTKFKVRPAVNLVKNLYGGKNIGWTSNIIFSNGLLDPWSGGGVTYNVSTTAVAILIPGAAHHLDLRFANPLDPIEIVQVRQYYKNVIKKWTSCSQCDSKSVEMV